MRAFFAPTLSHTMPPYLLGSLEQMAPARLWARHGARNLGPSLPLAQLVILVEVGGSEIIHPSLGSLFLPERMSLSALIGISTFLVW